MNSTTKQSEIFPRGSLFFAPMEGVTDAPYRSAIQRLYPEWDYLCTDFLRVPTQGHYTAQKLLKHFGEGLFDSPTHQKKTGYQILTSYRAQTKQTVEKLQDLDVRHLDLNLGCPSKKVNSHQGGAYLLARPDLLREIIQTIRQSYQGHFTVKMRTGYKDTELFLELIKMFEDEGVEAITIHGRTRDQLYKGVADWTLIKKAVETVSIPVIGNGDLWNVTDIVDMFEQTNCHAVMLGRGAMKTPWLAQLYKRYKNSPGQLNDVYLLEERKKELQDYFGTLEEEYSAIDVNSEALLKRFKSLSRHLFDDFDGPEEMRSRFLRSRTLEQFKERLDQLC